MGVRESCQGLGCGNMLMQHLLDRARTIAGIKTLKIETSSKLVNALQMYRKFGFIDDYEVEKSFHDYKDADLFLRLDMNKI